MTYQALAAQFDHHQTVNGFTTISGEQVVSRLNEVLGYDGWSFTVKEHGIHEESDSAWALGRLEIYREDGTVIFREQFGSQKFNRYNQGPNQGKIIDLANDMMGAATGALKKCASLIGVGLYLRAKGNSTGASRGNQGNQSRPGANVARNAQSNSSGSRVASATGAPIHCGECNDVLKEVTDANGKVWSPEAFANVGKRKYGQVLCADCYFARAS